MNAKTVFELTVRLTEIVVRCGDDMPLVSNCTTVRLLEDRKVAHRAHGTAAGGTATCSSRTGAASHLTPARAGSGGRTLAERLDSPDRAAERIC
jgi:hypothetical protein